MTGFVVVAAVKWNLQIINLLSNNHTVTININFREEPMRNVQFHKYPSNVFVKRCMEIFLQSNKSNNGVSNTS